MILTVDIGNTNIACGIHDAGTWVDHWRLRTESDRTADEYLVLFRSLFESSPASQAAVDRVVVSSVVPALTPAIVSVMARLTGREPLLVRHDMVTGLDPATPVPPELGNDLLANAVAGWRRFRDACIIVDFGTALTFTAVSRSGAILGVDIAPGLRSAVGALTSSTAQLRSVDLVPPPSALARTTEHSIQAGIIFGYVGLVREIVARMAAEMDGTPKTLATGGLVGAIAPLTEVFDAVDEWHTLDGLRILAELNGAE